MRAKRHLLPPLDTNRAPFIEAPMVVRSNGGHYTPDETQRISARSASQLRITMAPRPVSTIPAERQIASCLLIPTGAVSPADRS
jgi:hypothetical protein